MSQNIDTGTLRQLLNIALVKLEKISSDILAMKQKEFELTMAMIELKDLNEKLLAALETLEKRELGE